MPRSDETPLMQQWREAKARHPDALVFFRVGDFYEMFCEDAEEGARRLGLTLTTRNNGAAAEVPLAGVPARARDEYVERLIRQGRRVAICEQMEDPAEARGVVRRQVVETVTPGAVLSDSLLQERRNNYLAAVWLSGSGTGALAGVDVSTGEVLAAHVAADGLADELARLEPSEVLLPEGLELVGLEFPRQVSVTRRADWLFDRDIAEEELQRRYNVHGLDGFGFQEGDEALIQVLGGLVAYLGEIQPAGLEHLRAPRLERPGVTMLLDEMTRRNLELVEPLRPDLAGSAADAGTLIGVLDETVTAMGGRCLRRWLLAPLVNAEDVWARQEAVAVFHERGSLRRAIRGELQEIQDLERLAAKISTGRILPREMLGLTRSLARLPELRRLWESDAGSAAVRPGSEKSLLDELVGNLDPLADVHDLLRGAIADDPPAALGAGGVIKEGFDQELDELRAVRDGARDFIVQLQGRERKRSGISSLKVGYNKVFGYYLEVTRANLKRVPDDYERRQTLANSERYITPELKEWESRVLGAEERIAALELQLFSELRRRVAAELQRVQNTAARVARLDAMAALAETAELRDYVRPEVHTGQRLEVREGRHPVVETMMPRRDFIPNDLVLDQDERIMILTGPNMAGKSTLLRQVGLIQLLAQIGSFVPATGAKLAMCDRIFTRVGASDNLVRGQSTFMVEMQETASILNGATARSLILLDEIGRGTATYDGVSIAWAVTEHLHEEVRAKTIFATHYHELTRLAEMLPALMNANVSVKESGQQIIFLRRLQPGGADRSYGIQVGRLAGLPPVVVRRAREILRQLEGARGESGGEDLPGMVREAPSPTAGTDQLSLFRSAEHPVLERLRQLDINELSPLRSLNLLAELQDEARGGAVENK